MNTSEQDTPSVRDEGAFDTSVGAIKMKKKNKPPIHLTLKKSDSIELDENAQMSQSGLFFNIKSQKKLFRVGTNETGDKLVYYFESGSRKLLTVKDILKVENKNVNESVMEMKTEEGGATHSNPEALKKFRSIVVKRKKSGIFNNIYLSFF